MTDVYLQGKCSARGVSVWERVGNVAGEDGAVVGHAIRNNSPFFVFFCARVATEPA